MKYPTYIEVPKGYWTMTAISNADIHENPNKYWHNNDKDSFEA